MLGQRNRKQTKKFDPHSNGSGAAQDDDGMSTGRSSAKLKRVGHEK